MTERILPDQIKNKTEMQEKFLNALFTSKEEGGAEGNLRDAARMAGYSNKTTLYYIVKGIKKELVERAFSELAMTSPEAIFALKDVMRHPAALGNNEKRLAAREILDRAGVIKVEKIEHKGDGNAIVILPPKKEIKENEDE